MFVLGEISDERGLCRACGELLLARVPPRLDHRDYAQWGGILFIVVWATMFFGGCLQACIPHGAPILVVMLGFWACAGVVLAGLAYRKRVLERRGMRPRPRLPFRPLSPL